MVAKIVNYILHQPHTVHVLVKQKMGWTTDEFISIINGDKKLNGDDVTKLLEILQKPASFFNTL